MNPCFEESPFQEDNPDLFLEKMWKCLVWRRAVGRLQQHPPVDRGLKRESCKFVCVKADLQCPHPQADTLELPCLSWACRNNRDVEKTGMFTTSLWNQIHAALAAPDCVKSCRLSHSFKVAPINEMCLKKHLQCIGLRCETNILRLNSWQCSKL